ncbi:MAG: acyl carrier protein [Acidimicrobiales bacterium]
MTKESGDVVDDIRSIVAAHGRLSVDIATLGNDEDLFHKGMTSTASVGVMFALQAHFGLEFPDSMLRRSTFESVSAIQAAVSEMLAAPRVE